MNDSTAWLSTSSPAQAATTFGSVRVLSGIKDPERRAQVAVGDAGLGPFASKSKMATAVVSLPVPAVVGTAISGLSGRAAPGRANRRVDVVDEVGRLGGVEVGGLGRVDRGATADGDETVEAARRRDRDRRFERGVRRLDRTSSNTSNSTPADRSDATAASPG